MSTTLKPGIVERLAGIDGAIGSILNRHPAVGMAVGLVRYGSLEFFHGHGVADVAANTPITADTAFRIASITKLFTAIAVMQLWERGLVDLDAPANDYLRAYKLTSAQAGFRPATLRHLLTHTAGVPEVRHLSDLFHPSWGPFDARPAVLSVDVGGPMPPLADYYAGGLESVVEPGRAFAYSNHGFATLGQIIEDVSGTPLDRYLREHLFDSLRMSDTSLVRSDFESSHLATGYNFDSRGPRPTRDREWIGAGSVAIYSTTRDMAGFVAALLQGGANRYGTVLSPATLANMFQPHYQPDHRLPGMGLGFFRSEAGGHRLVGHDGLLPGFNSHLSLAPDDGVGVIAFTNGSRGAFVWLQIEVNRLLRRLLAVPDEVVRTDIPHRPEIWGDIVGRYRLPVGISDLRGRVIIGAGAQVYVHGGRLMARLLTPIPALCRGFPLHPDDEQDPYLFRLDLSRQGMASVRIVFGREARLGTTALHTDLHSLSLYREVRA